MTKSVGMDDLFFWDLVIIALLPSSTEAGTFFENPTALEKHHFGSFLAERIEDLL